MLQSMGLQKLRQTELLNWNQRTANLMSIASSQQEKYHILRHMKYTFNNTSNNLYLLCSVTSVVSDSVTPWNIAQQAPLSMGFSREEYLSGLPFPSPGDHPNPGIDPASPALAGGSLPLAPPDYLINNPEGLSVLTHRYQSGGRNGTSLSISCY